MKKVITRESPCNKSLSFNSTNSTQFGTVLTYYCTNSRYMLVGRPKLMCTEDGSWNGETPSCRSKDRQDPLEKLLEMTSASSGPTRARPPFDRRPSPTNPSRERQPAARQPPPPFRRLPAVPNRPLAYGKLLLLNLHRFSAVFEIVISEAFFANILREKHFKLST